MTGPLSDSTGSTKAIDTYDDLEALHQAAADAFCELVDRAVDERGIARISLSGGSTPKRLYELLAERKLPWQKIHWFWGDERNVPPDHADSNQRMVREAMTSRVGVAEANLHPVVVAVDKPEVTARRYEELLREHFAGDDFPSWDLTLLGMGDDAHTASLFPTTAALQETNRWFVENWVAKFDAFRFTLTAPAINSARESWFLVTGSGKRDALRHVWTGQGRPELYPSQLIQATRWFVTQDADPRRSE